MLWRGGVLLSRIEDLKEMGQADTEWCSIEVGCVVHGGAILMLLDSFTHFSLLRLWPGMEGVLYTDIVCTSQVNAWNCFPVPGWGRTE